MNAILFALAIHLLNGNLQPLSSLRAAPANGWVGYMVKARESIHISCCDGCSLAGDCMNVSRRESNDIGPAGEDTIALFVRLEGGVVERVRAFSPTCTLDAAGQNVRWADNVSQDESIAFLRNAAEHGSKHGANNAIFALSLQAGSTDTLIDLARNGTDRDIRGKALFWLSQQAGQKAAAALKDAAENDPEESVRAKAVFGISQLPNDESIPMLVDLMKNHHSREVRRKAAFWLGQKNDPRAVAAIEDFLMK